MADKESTTTISVSSQPNNPLSKKLNKILETRLENDKDVLEALKSLSGFFYENNIRTRRNLRGDIERRSIVLNEEFINSFKVVTEKLDSIYKDVESMNACCQDMTLRLKSAKEQTHDLINQTTKLQAESQKLQLRSLVADAFLAKFQLKPEEVQTLRGTRDNVLHPDFFSALAHVKQIHTDCKILLRTNQQTAGLEIMESMALHQESAYERLYRWTQNECCLLTSDSPDISTKLCQAMEALQDRPVLFRYTLDEFSNARRSAVVRSFIDALTRGGPSSMPRPIELHSHDPLRYLGDMLAWIHQATASEEEHIQALLKKCFKIATGDCIKDALQHITEGICRPLKVRLEQVLMSEPGPIVLYKLLNLIKFYEVTIGQVLNPNAALPSTLEEMHTLSVRMFFTSLTYNANKLLEKVELPPADLGPTAALNKMLQLLQEILSSHDSSVVAPDERKTAFSQILSSLIDPLVQMCSVSASRLNTIDMATYMVNCLYLIQSTVALYEYTEQRLEMLQAQIDAHIDTLVSEQASYILNSSGLAVLYNTIQQHQPEQGLLSKIPGMDPNAIKAIMNKFDSFLGSSDSLLLQQTSHLLSSEVRNIVKRRSIELVCLAYKQVYASLIIEENGYPDPRSLAPRLPDQVEQLLS